MDPMPDYSLFLGRILEELDAKHSSMSYQDLCKSLCARFDLVHLVKLRSLLFYTACLDPCFPATLFRDKMRATTEDQQSRKLMAAADIVTMFNLIQMNNGTAKDRLPSAHRPKFHKNQSFESCRSDSDMYKYSESDRSRDLLYSRGRRISPCPKSECGDRQPFVPSSNSGCHLGINRDLKYRAASLDKLQHLPPYHPNSPTSCDMQSTYFPMEIDSESTTDQDSLQLNPGIKAKLASHREPFSVYSCVQKRNIFKEDFHNLVAFCPQVITTDSKHICNHSGTFQRKEPQKPAAFFNHSFELPYSNPYFESVGSPLQEKRRSKHESLDDLQASTYFGPTTITESINGRRTMGRQGKQPSWPVKSMSLNTDDGPDFEGCLVGSKLSKDGHGRNISSAGSEKHYQGNKDKSSCSPSRFSNQSNGPKSLEAGLLANGRSADNREALMRFKDKSINCPSLQPADIDDGLSVGTQTEQSDPKKLKDFGANNKYTERHSFKISDEDSEIVSDDISDIFRFLDDMSVSGSLGVIQSSCYNSNGSLTQIAKSDGDSSPEHGATKLKKAGLKLDRLFSSLENTDGELKASVCKLVLRIGEIEKKLESLSGVRGEISQVLSKLNKLDEKIQEPEDTGKPCEDGRVHETHVESNTAPVIFQCHTTGNSLPVGGTVDWCCSEASGSTSDSLRVKALKKSVFTRRSSRSLNEENSVTESKIASITNSPRDWRASCPSHPVVDGTEKERNCKDRHRKSKEMDRQGDAVCTHRSSKPAKEQPYLVEQVFTPHRFPPVAKVQTRGSPLYADLRLVERSDGKRSQPPPWPLEEYKLSSGEKAKLSALDLQTQESLNPNHLEYWMEDIYSPGYDSLLKRKEAEFRRAKACKMGVLIAAAACTVILVIVVPMCTMKS